MLEIEPDEFGRVVFGIVARNGAIALADETPGTVLSLVCISATGADVSAANVANDHIRREVSFPA